MVKTTKSEVVVVVVVVVGSSVVVRDVVATINNFYLYLLQKEIFTSKDKHTGSWEAKNTSKQLTNFKAVEVFPQFIIYPGVTGWLRSNSEVSENV